MSVVPLTLTISLCLVFTFVVFFLREQTRRRFGSAESDALLPFSEEQRATESPAGAVTVDLGNRMPRKRRGACGREHGPDHVPCGKCSHAHDHDHGQDHAHS